MGRGKVQYAWNHEIALAYEVVGEGAVDLLYLQSNISNVEVNWENPELASFLTELAGLGRLAVVDRRGLGCSERFTPDGAPSIETLIDDVLAVIEAVGCERPVLVATGDCGFFSCMLAATHPDRLGALILINAAPTWQRSDETPWARTEAEMEQSFRWCQDNWGSGAWSRRANPSVSSDRDLRWFGRYERLAQSPGALYAEARRFAETDVRAVLPAVQVPTLVLHRSDNTEERVEGGRYLGAHIPGATFVELDGPDHFPWLGDAAAVLREIHRFLRTVRAEEADLDREGGRAWGSRLAGVGRASRHDRAGTPLALPRSGSQYNRGRLLRDLRRTGASDPLCHGYPSRAGEHRYRGSRRPPHRRNRDDRGKGRWDRGDYSRARA